jgi:cytoskeletal protein RodZ
VLNDAKTSAFVPGQPVRKANFKAVYALIPFAIVIAGGIYWWKSNSAQTAIHPSSEMPTSSVEIQVPAAVSPPNPKSAPTAESAPNPAPVPTSEPASQIPAIPESEPSPAEAPVTKAVSAAPVLRKVPPVAPANSQHAKRESAKVPAASAKPDTAGKSVGMVNPPVASAQPPAKAVVPKSAAPAKTLDALYQDRITAECPQGFFPGFACREKVRWQVCDGKWSPDAIAGQTTCKGSGSK